ncbi:hypothetical protein H3146_00060 [Streptomyces sp. OF3]|uniref:MarR family transcriptional regulator n=1 Tax=Streptomyces alkaliterrae TaxID=2213162 RepID=A0A7W3WGK1_9ACTN|nr:hypothetical protein [Streptomyces alkaliterrae]MBB1251765.1 hypothetical protein [Streptomyces alkaliterrae]
MTIPPFPTEATTDYTHRYYPPVYRNQVLWALRHTHEPVTAATLANALLPAHMPSAITQTGRALRQLEARGDATRDHGRPWIGPDYWRAAPR